jgi:gas vesicle protein
MAQPAFDWDSIRREYIQGFVVVDPETGDRRPVYPTLEDLAQRHGCALVTIRQRSSREKPTWSEQRSALRAKLAEREDDLRVSYYLSESAALDAEVLSLVRDHLKIVREYLNQHLPKVDEAQTLLTEDDRIIKPKAVANVRLKIQDLEASSRVLKNIQEVGRRTVSEPVTGVREFLTDLKQETNTDANAVRSQIERLQKRLKDRSKKMKELNQFN